MISRVGEGEEDQGGSLAQVPRARFWPVPRGVLPVRGGSEQIHFRHSTAPGGALCVLPPGSVRNWWEDVPIPGHSLEFCPEALEDAGLPARQRTFLMFIEAEPDQYEHLEWVG